ncbi:phage tail tube protein [Rhizobium leguminosarum]|uniref:phage tail tube protein n=1 Tax=Rhizobium leguminosarum TaxID=384 RepID=UPI003D06EE37
MAETQAAIGYGMVLELALASTPATRVYIPEITSATPPSDEDDQVEATHMQSPNRYREYIPGLTDSGEAEFEMNLVPGSDADRFLMSVRGKKLIAYLTWANGVSCIFNCSRQSYEKDTPTDDKMTATLTLKASGEPILTEIAAPRNLIAPKITGVAKVGVPLTVDPGVWAGAEELEFQWKADAAAILDETGSSFVPKVGNIGDVITITVTGKNSDFDSEATSAATIAVVA